MYVGAARVMIQIPGARSLKDRRQVVRSLKERLRARLPVSVAEVGDVERPQVATLGVAVVGPARPLVDDILGQVRQAASTRPDALLADFSSEVFGLGAGGRELSPGIEGVLEDDGALPEHPAAIEWQEEDDSDDQ